MSYYANGELKVVYLTADKSIPEKVENAFLYVNQRYDYDCDISDTPLRLRRGETSRIQQKLQKSCLNYLQKLLRLRTVQSLISAVKTEHTGDSFLKTVNGKSKAVR